MEGLGVSPLEGAGDRGDRGVADYPHSAGGRAGRGQCSGSGLPPLGGMENSSPGKLTTINNVMAPFPEARVLTQSPGLMSTLLVMFLRLQIPIAVPAGYRIPLASLSCPAVQHCWAAP